MKVPLVENFTPMPCSIAYLTIGRSPADHRLPAADVDVEDLQGAELVEHRLRFAGRQLAGVAAPDDERQCTQARLQA